LPTAAAPVTGGVAAATNPDQELNNLIKTMLTPEAGGGGLAAAVTAMRNTPIEDAAAALEVERMQAAEKARVAEAARPSYGFPTKYGVYGASFDQPLTPEQETGIEAATRGRTTTEVERAMTASGGQPDALTAALNQLAPTTAVPAADAGLARAESTKRAALLEKLGPTQAALFGRLPTGTLEERLRSTAPRTTAVRGSRKPRRRYAGI
jgi:hypothetical protein